MADSLPLMDRVLARRYRPVRRIASGGMAEVWEGYDDVLARPVAIKVLHPHLAADASFAERFRREAVAAARLTHPAIVATFDTGTDGDVAFIVMELVRGRTLRDALTEAGSLPPAVAVPIAAEVAAALEHAHQAGLVHRDVKPANILLCEHDGETAPLLRVKVADFGIAKLHAQAAGTGGDLTQTGAVVGTARYLSPEQVQGMPPDARSDVYALGVVLYEMLCGRTPFVAESDLATALQHVRAHPPPPRQLRASIPGRVESVVLRALAKDPADRFQSAADMEAALRACQVDGKIEVDEEDDAVPAVVRDPTPPSGVPPASRPSPRRLVGPVLVAVGVAVAVVALALLAGTDGAGRGGGGTGGAAGGEGARAVRVAAARSFDPEGPDREENEARARLAADGNPSTSWATDQYKRRPFGGLKRGVGLVVQLSERAPLASLHVRSPSRSWAATVYVADRPAGQLSGWGEPVASRTGISGDATFDLQGRRGAAVLLWITDPGTSRRAEVAEVTVRAR